MDVVNATLNLTINGSTANVNGTNPAVDDPQGLAIAYFSLFIMAIIPIYVGAQKSVSRLRDQKKNGGDSVETLSNNDAFMFPLYASAALFGLYLFFKIFSKQYINMLLSTYFFFLGVLALTNTLNPYIDKYVPDLFQNVSYHIKISKGNKENSNSNEESDKSSEVKEESLFEYSYRKKEFIGLAIAAAVGLWYMVTKHWIANNLFGLAFSVSAVELMHLNKVVTGCILLGGLFIYDIFWVFGTNVMVTVAKSFEAPIKLVFPRDMVITGFSSTNFAMLGLGDIVIPGIFIALLLRFDHSQKKGNQTYFLAGYAAYILGLMTTMVVMHVFKHAQPALLYLVPACLGIPILLSVVLGDRVKLFDYEDKPSSKKED